MGSSWRYRHVAIMPYSLGGFHGLPCMFFTGLLVLFHGLAFRFNGRAREFTCRWKTTGWHWSKQKNKSAQSAGPTFSQHFPTQVSPHYIQLDPIYYGFMFVFARIEDTINCFQDFLTFHSYFEGRCEISMVLAKALQTIQGVHSAGTYAL